MRKPLSIYRLRCEYFKNPLGVETRAPRLSWQLESDRRGARQTAYRITVASSKNALDDGRPDLWDSGRRKSDASVLIPYEGRKLRSRRRCWWRVYVWDETACESVSETAWWEMGLLLPSDWRAQWISGTTPKKHHGVPASPVLRKTFDVSEVPVRARAYVCGLGFYEFYLNGRKVGDAVLHPAFTKYDARALYSVFDITPYLVRGENTAGILLGTGWYDHHAKDNWGFFDAPWRDECKALCQMEIVFGGGGGMRVLSDVSWRFSTGPIVFDGLRNGEVYDAREEKTGWNDVGYHASRWEPARIARPPGGRLCAQLMPPCRVIRRICPVSLHEVKPGVWVYDMGENIAGWSRLTVKGPAGTSVTMCYAERLDPEGDVDQSLIKRFVATDIFQTDTYILKGDGVETYEPRFVYHGFRYVRVTGLPCAAKPEMLEGRVVHTDLERTGFFECSNDLLNRIQQAVIASTTSNYHGIPTDCPHREKNGWTGDAQLAAEQVLYNFDASAAYAKWLDDFSDCRRLSGALPAFVPAGGGGVGFNAVIRDYAAGPVWDSACILIPWYLYLYRGDVEILTRHYSGMKQYLGFLEHMATGHIVHAGLGDVCPPFSEPNVYKTPAELTNTAYYYAVVRIMEKTAMRLGRKADARRFSILSGKIRATIRRRYYDKENSRVAGQCQTSLACFLYHGLVDPDEVEPFKAMLLDEVSACNDHIGGGILGAKYVLNVLTDLECADVAYRIAAQRDYPGWGNWIEKGSTTLWETWDGQTSLNHNFFSDISAWFYKTLAGIRLDPDHPGFKSVIIKPWPVGGLTWAKGETHTPYGRLRCGWRVENGRFVLHLSIPANSSAHVHMPTSDWSSVTENGRPATAEKNVAYEGMIQGRAVYRVESGDYLLGSSAVSLGKE